MLVFLHYKAFPSLHGPGESDAIDKSLIYSSASKDGCIAGQKYNNDQVECWSKTILSVLKVQSLNLAA